ncbi:endonuclease/exonuclease/phosphatase family protein [Janibacter hoylei]|uniref:endonuclease/exonuclease/phosphatase family protein n=1 Tax=Janibacter hoylei TaxID=364298 RepID=UPI0035CCFC24
MTLRVATFNVNGIRAAQRRGFEAWLAEREPDVVALQEVRCPPAQLPPGVFGDHHLTYEPGQIAGRNGVAVLTRTRPAGGAHLGRRGPHACTRRGTPAHRALPAGHDGARVVPLRQRREVRRGGPRGPPPHRRQPVPAEGRAAGPPAEARRARGAGRRREVRTQDGLPRLLRPAARPRAQDGARRRPRVPPPR